MPKVHTKQREKRSASWERCRRSGPDGIRLNARSAIRLACRGRHAVFSAPRHVRAAIHDAVALLHNGSDRSRFPAAAAAPDRRSEEHTSELQSLMRISYAV